MQVTDEQILQASINSISASEAARLLGINYKTYRSRASKLGVFKPNQGLKGVNKPKSRKYSVNDCAFDDISNEVAYWLGFIAADGSIVKNTLRFVLNRQDRNHLDRFMEFLNSDYTVHNHTAYYIDTDGIKHCFDACNCKITSEHIVETLSKYGIIQRKKYSDIDFLSYIPSEYKLDFVVGFFDGDGSVSTGSNSCFTIACNKNLSYHIGSVLLSQGVIHRVSHRETIDVIYITNKIGLNKFCQIYLSKSNMYPVLQRKLISCQKLYIDL